MKALAVLLAPFLLVGTAVPSYADTVTPQRGAHTFTTKDAMVQVVDGPSNTHSATIDTRLYLPDNATAGNPQPAILMTHGFGLTKLAGEIVSSATFLARHGYVVLTYTAQGFGSSSGCVTLQSRTYDVKDAQQLITKVLDPLPVVKHDTNGSVVGMVGGSYGGGIQANVAENDKRIHAISPGRTWNNLAYSLDPNNYVVPGDATGFTHTLNKQGVFKQQWTTLFFVSGNANPIGGAPPGIPPQPAGGCPQDKLASGDPATVAGIACPGWYSQVCITYAGITATGDANDTDRALLADASGATQIDKLRIPVLLVQGESDTLFNENDAVATYTALRRNGVPVKMIWNSGGHGGYDSLPGECDVYGRGTGGSDFSGLDDCYLSLRTLAFLDNALRGVPDDSPGFTYFRDWVTYGGKGANDEQYGDAPAFPVAGSTTFTLSGSDKLVTSGASAGSASFVNPPAGLPPAYTETSNFSGPASSPQNPLPPTEQPGQHVDFTSAPFTSDVVSVGIPAAHLRLAHAAPTDLVFFGKVYDIAPDGSATLIHRLIAPVRAPAADVAKPIDIKLVGFAHRFAKGHAVRLTLAATDATSYNNKAPDQITVTTGAGSTFTLPGVQARSATPPHVVVLRPPSAPTGQLPATGPEPLLPLTGLGLLAVAFVVRRRWV
ncbi:MAG: type transport system ATP-binding protein [Actinomycetota bacterium]|jgi:ABC-2 type transport system ATP-binding protein|nr:type transport system ATP-binding protein [Actinomycetota bacterium]